MDDSWSFYRALAQLPEEQRRAVQLRYRDGHSAAEVGAALDYSEVETTALLKTARQRVSQLLDESGG